MAASNTMQSQQGHSQHFQNPHYQEGAQTRSGHDRSMHQRKVQFQDSARLYEMNTLPTARGHTPQIRKWHSVHESQSRGQVNGNSDGCEQRETEPSDPVFHQAHHLQTASNTIQDNLEEASRLQVSEHDSQRSRLNSRMIIRGVRETKILKEHAAYHQAISGEEAEQRLKKCGGHCYLTRYSNAQECYVLSVHQHQRHSKPTICHFKIVIEDNGEHKIDGKVIVFQDIHSLLEHYEKERIDPALRSIGKAYTEAEYMLLQQMEDEQNRRICTIL